MAKRQGAGKREKAETGRWADVKHLLTAGGLVFAVLATLVIGAVLRVDEPLPIDPVTDVQLAPPPATADEPAAAATGEGAAPAAADDDDGLARRVLDDERRISTTANEWTLQFMMTCKEDTARRVLEETRGDRRLHLLPVLHEDRPCFRICWGRFPSKERAQELRDVPGALLALNDSPIPREIQGLMP